MSLNLSVCVSRSACLSLSCVHRSVCVWVCSVRVSPPVSLPVGLCPSLYLCLCVSFCPYVSALLLSLSVSLSLWFSISMSVHVSVSVYVCVSGHVCLLCAPISHSVSFWVCVSISQTVSRPPSLLSFDIFPFFSYLYWI